MNTEQVINTAWKMSKYGVFLIPIFPHSYWTWRDTPYLSVFSPNAGKYGLEKAPYLDTFHVVQRYFTPTLKRKDYNVIIDARFLDQPIRNDKKIYENIRKLISGQGDDYTTGCLIYYPYFKKNFNADSNRLE